MTDLAVRGAWPASAPNPLPDRENTGKNSHSDPKNYVIPPYRSITYRSHPDATRTPRQGNFDGSKDAGRNLEMITT